MLTLAKLNSLPQKAKASLRIWSLKEGDSQQGSRSSNQHPHQSQGGWIPNHVNAAELSMSLSPFILAFVQKKQM